MHGRRRIELQRLFEVTHADRGVFRHHRGRMRQGAQIEVVGVKAVGPLTLGALNLGAAEIWLDDSDDAMRDLVLQIAHVLDRAVVPIRPQVRARLGFEQLRRDTQARSRFANAALQHVTHAQFAPDLPDVDRLALVDEARIASDHEQPFDSRKPGDDVLDNPVDKIFLLGVCVG